MHTALPGASISTFRNESGVNEAASYQVVFNGMSVDPGKLDREQARQSLLRLPNVKNVYLDYAYASTLYTSTTLINAPALWNATTVGGQANAGAGIKVASVDGGIHKDAPMFSGAGYSYPADFPAGGKGLTANNNGKIIASRVYFRTWDPPAAGDENPWPGEAGTPHGVHTSGIAAGNLITNGAYAGLTLPPFSGVAPKAWVMSYRVFYQSVTGDGSFYTSEGIAALEDAVADGADVINNSWGGGPGSEGGEFDALDQALRNANAAGVFVSMSAGNAGPGGHTTDHPSDDYISVAATSTSGTLASGRVSITAPTPISTTLQNKPYGSASFGEPLEIGKITSHPFKTAASVDPNNGLGCSPFPAGTFTGKAAVISRGVCEFGLKVLNAEKAGATFAVIYNSTAGGDAVINMGAGTVGAQVTISSVFVGRSMGLGMVQWYADHADDSVLTINTVAFQSGNTPDVVASFSSRGPGVGNVLKPDIAAPGVNILSQGYTPGVTGEARHLGFGQVSGTSMASPHVAGAAALLRQIHPNWSNAYIKSALMSTAKYMDIFLDAAQTIPAQPLDMGAGRLDLTHAATPGVILDPPSLSYGLVPQGSNKAIQVTLTSVASAPETYNVTTLFTGDSFTQTTTLPGFSVSPASVTLAPGEQKTVTVTFTSASSQGLGDNQGYIVLDGATYDAHMPAWARVTNANKLADVLIIDNDLSALNPAYGLPPMLNYVDYYTRTLTTLGYDYDIWDVDAHAADASVIPDSTTLFAYDAVIFFTGDNYFQVLSTTDMDRLTEYANNGGFLLAMGQDLSAALASDTTDSPFLYGFTLGAEWLQDSVTDGGAPAVPVASSEEAPPAFKDLFVNLGISPLALTSANEVPAVTVDNDTLGLARLSYFAADRELKYSIQIRPTEPITLTASHIHTGTAQLSGGVLYTLYGGPARRITAPFTFSGSITLSPEHAQALLASRLYINVHTTRNPAGEVRGQITPAVVRDGADNQFYIDEIQPPPTNAPSVPGEGEPSISLLRYPGPNNEEDGIVTVAHADQPSLERPGISYRGRSIYASFGLEGVNNIPDASSREDLLQTFFSWAKDRPTVTISRTLTSDTSKVMAFTAAVTSPVTDTTGVTYRWDFGDGTPIVGPTGSADSLHTYASAVCGLYTVRVEATDSYGHRTIGTLDVNIDDDCTRRIFLPLLKR